MKKTILCIIGMSAMCLLSACNTMEGMGSDIKEGGQNLHNAAQNSKDRMEHDDTDTDNHAYHPDDDNDNRSY